MKVTGAITVGGNASKRAFLALSMIFLASCRLVISIDETGQIISLSGDFDCEQTSCEFEITEEVTETFTAVPASGYRFVGWRGICVLSPSEVCDARIIPLPEEFSELDGDVELSAIFESSSVKRIWYRDRDGDHYGDATRSVSAYERPEGFAINKSDCDDSDSAIRPWVQEIDDGIDNNCNGKVDEGFVEVRFFRDSDGDGFGDPDVSQMSTSKPAGYVRRALDCNDSRREDHPGATEIGDGRDNDCDGEVDEGGTRLFRDVDGDGYGVRSNAIESLQAVQGYVEIDGDCDDSNHLISPAAQEKFDSVDNDCDGQVDEGFTVREYFRDVDGDGYGDPSEVVADISRPEGYAENAPDNCLEIANPGQEDLDEDGIGDACDEVDDRNTGEPEDPCAISSDQQAMLNAVNSFRSQPRSCGSSGDFPAVAPLTWRCELKTAALGHSQDMANNNFFSHTGSDGSSAGDRISRAGYRWSAWGENIAAGLSYSAVDAVMDAWINSPGHCANLMGSQFTNFGAAKFSDPSSTYRLYWTQVFGRPR